MNELQVINFNGQYVVDSREVAEMVGKRHADLLRDIETYTNYLSQNAKLRSDEFFIESSYKAGTGKSYKCYLLTKQGCEMVANKLTGEKGVLFTATYVKKFNEMEQQQRIDTSKLSPELQMFNHLFTSIAQTQLKQQEHDKRLLNIEKQQENIKEIVALNPVEWRKKTTAILNKIAIARGGFGEFKNIRQESYDLLEARARCKLDIRLNNRKKEALANGIIPKSKIEKMSKLDVIADDPRLTEIYIAIVKEMAIKYQISTEGLGA